MKSGAKVSIRRWIWSLFVQTALIPLLLVETLLIAAYLHTNASIRDAQIANLRSVVLDNLKASSAQETQILQGELSHIAKLADTYASLAQDALRSTQALPPAKLGESANGVRYSEYDDGGSASFYSSATPLAKQDLRKVAGLAQLDPFMRETVRNNDLVSSIYFNSWDSYSRSYPWIDTLHQFPPGTVIPSFNFYYLATETHNPQRQPTWTDVYLDPAGQGWILSAIAPVFLRDFLKGVVGLDITIDKLLEHLNSLDMPWGGYTLIVDKHMGVIALSEDGKTDLGLQGVRTDTTSSDEPLFIPDAFNLLERADTRPLAKAMADRESGVVSISLSGHEHLAAWATIKATNWQLLTVVEEQQVFQQTNTLAGQYRSIGYLLIAGLVAFYLVFFALMWGRIRILSDKLNTPILGIDSMLQDIGAGKWRPARPDTNIVELQGIIDNVLVMGEKLECSSSRLASANQDAEQGNLAKSRFISSMSHELRTPLNAIQGFAQLIRMKGSTRAEHGDQDYLEEILLASRHLNQVLGDILDWSTAEGEQLRLDMRKVDAAALMHECAELVTLDMAAHGLTQHLDLPAEALHVRADVRRLRQVLLNLLSNAIKYSRQGTVSLACSLRDSTVRMTVSDTGPGIAPQHHEHLFEPFQRLGQEKTSIPGTGIGLSICRDYARLMGGELGFHSQVGVGSQFWIELPLYIESVPERARAIRVYLGDQDKTNIEAVHSALQGITVEQFDRGQHLLKALLRERPDLVLISGDLSGLDAAELLSEIRRTPQLSSVPVVLLCKEDQVRQMVALGANGLLSVPIDGLELQQLVDALTNKEVGGAL
ncbi:sensor histidine kinase [Phytopseudomonas punonensis]|uniref:histidine kinase n=1 Tax=Phytopseudomonas punonensis TaxID=1220495 RepID=A0A1M7G8J6_9GAMM|nr:sensor histidine kinase [Pseudomonas punonensis]SHM12257.1 Signal transduction histidine kinase [Pseudomonas punonensis]